MSKSNYSSDDFDGPSGLLPADIFDRQLAQLIGLPGGAHTRPVVVQAADFYGNVTQFVVQIVRSPEQGDFVFVTQTSARGLVRYILPPNVLSTIDRGREANTTRIRRTTGRRLAAERAERGELPGFMKGKRKK